MPKQYSYTLSTSKFLQVLAYFRSCDITTKSSPLKISLQIPCNINIKRPSTSKVLKMNNFMLHLNTECLSIPALTTALYRKRKKIHNKIIHLYDCYTLRDPTYLNTSYIDTTVQTVDSNTLFELEKDTLEDVDFFRLSESEHFQYSVVYNLCSFYEISTFYNICTEFKNYYQQFSSTTNKSKRWSYCFVYNKYLNFLKYNIDIELIFNSEIIKELQSKTDFDYRIFLSIVS